MSKFKVGDKVRCTTIEGMDGEHTVTAVLTDELSSKQSIKISGFIGYFRSIDFQRAGFTNSDLKDGMRVERADGSKYYVIEGYLVQPPSKISSDCDSIDFYSLSSVNNDLSTSWQYKGASIMKVTDRDGTLLFERKPEKRKVTLELTDEQIELIKTQIGVEL